MDGKWRLLSPHQYDCELVKMEKSGLFIGRTVLRMDRMFLIP
jgi:hypothetical protein